MSKNPLEIVFGENEKGVICVGSQRNNNFYVIAYPPVYSISSFCKNLEINPQNDYYITANVLTTLENKSKTQSNLLAIDNIVIDIDCHSNIDEYSKIDSFKELLFRISHDKIIQQPNIIHYTGRGLQLWFCIERMSGKLSFLYKIAVDMLIKILQDIITEYELPLKIDCVASKNIVGYFRLFETFNTKTGKKTEYEIKHEVKLNINDFISQLEEAVPIQEPKKQVTLEKTYEGLQRSRMKKIEFLIKLRNSPIGNELRDIFLFLYYNASVQIMNRDEAKKLTNKLNKELFKNSLDNLDYIYKYIDEKGFLKFKTATFNDWIQITENEEKEWQKNKRRKANKQERNEKIIELKKQGYKNKEIAKKLNIDQDTVTNFFKKSEFKPKESQKDKIQRMLDSGMSINDICLLLKISKRTFYRRIEKK